MNECGEQSIVGEYFEKIKTNLGGIKVLIQLLYCNDKRMLMRCFRCVDKPHKIMYNSIADGAVAYHVAERYWYEESPGIAGQDNG